VSAEDWKLMDLVRWTADFFKKHDLPSPRLDAEVLLAHVLDMKRMDLYLGFDQPVSEADRARFRELVRRRAKERWPVAYLTGVREFWSMPFRVTPDVLIPRPETETLVRVVAELKPRRIVELGVGSGCVSAALARELPDVEITAVDCSAAALEVARQNLASLGFAERVRLVLASGLASLEGPFDLVVSNPPYIEAADIDCLAPELRHEPRVALDGGPDGLHTVRCLCVEAPALLERPGWLALEIGLGQADAVEELLRGAGAAEVQVFPDLAGIPRVVLGRFLES
jgi:release factor glutamine methyltransferase